MTVDRTLHHFPLDPASRQVRLALGEKRLAFADAVVRYWERPKELTKLNPSGMAPVAWTPAARAKKVACRSFYLDFTLLEDYWVRRSARAWFDPDGGLGALEPAAEAMGELLGWSGEERRRQIASCRAIHEASMAFQHA